MAGDKEHKFRALVDLSLRKSPTPCKCPSDDLDDRIDGCTSEWHEFYDWPSGTEFDAPQHLNVKRGLERGIFEEVN